MIRTPLPRQRTQKYNQTYPLHALQRTFLLSCKTLQNKTFSPGLSFNHLLSPQN
uniref:Uncharacterized protein n=1 Tax=Anser cygnoides TaxID=8845 RepID=A0A8B9IHB6_ANSCY